MPGMSPPFSPRSARNADAISARKAAALQTWFAALADRDNNPANVVCLGDSITEGEAATTYAKRWVNRFRDQLRARYPTTGITGGVGFIPCVTSVTTFTWPVARTSGTASFEDNQGPKKRAAKMSAATTYTFTVTGTAIDIMWYRFSGGGTFSYTVDGGAAANVSTSGTKGDGQLTRVSLGSSGAHTVTINWVSGTAYVDGIIVYDGDENAGIRVHEAGHSGISAVQWDTATDALQWPKAVAALNPKLLIYSLGVNDLGQNNTPAQFKAAVQSMLTAIRTAGVSPSVVLQMFWTPNYTGTGGTWDQFVAAAYEIAASDSAVCVLNQTLRMPNVSGDTLGLYNDTVHPTNKGHAMVADCLTGFVTAG